MTRIATAGSRIALMRLLPAACCLGAAVVLATLSATPADAVNSKVRTACKDDYLRFCPSYEPDSTKARQCMRQAGKRLTPKCLNALADAGEIHRSKKR